jgi:hypothetical protein
MLSSTTSIWEVEGDFLQFVNPATKEGINSRSKSLTRTAAAESLHALHSTWTFWLDSWGSDRTQATYLQRRCLGAFSSIEYFWRYYNNLDWRLFPRDATLQLFREGEKPDWESHLAGGQFKLYRPAGRDSPVVGAAAPTLWEDLVLALLGETLPSSTSVLGIGVCCKDVGNEVVKVWVKDASDVCAIRSLQMFLPSLRPGFECVFKPHSMLIEETSTPGGRKGSFRGAWTPSLRRQPEAAITTHDEPPPTVAIPPSIKPPLPIDDPTPTQTLPANTKRESMPFATDLQPVQLVLNFTSPKKKRKNSKKTAQNSPPTAAVTPKVSSTVTCEPSPVLEKLQKKKRQFIAPKSQRLLEAAITFWFVALTFWILQHSDFLSRNARETLAAIH